ncbi:ABC-2 type transport system ATP-binding protein [Nitrosospira sp. Nsp14]|uniref:ATP-binding cassette domain-containing protein n=1 Tax=Nitrosospira sp. Nsp14 TaxID=1855333 RepID=UPI0008F22EB9|nr:ATP-binding cassette domain-containing protein [Nitrosospira sp. Nsp14]SFH54059.1 ABC-2 type transport system ATP-binding protein [Nitrosospira sp. Nsp14]
MNEAAALAGNGLHKRFLIKETGQTVLAVTDVSLEVLPGTLTALVGPDGAGKTTLLRMMAGLMQADQGRLEVLGIDVATDPQAVQDRISYMPQRFGLYEDLSVQENLDLYADLHGVTQEARKERYRRLLHMTNLARFTDRPAGKLSGGMKQKLGLACTLVRAPELLLLDEPTVGVDPLSRVELWEIILQMIHDERLTVLVTTAYLDEAERCARVFVLHEGKLLTSGTPADIRGQANNLCFIAIPPQDQPPRILQARLLDDAESIIDAVPQGGAVRFIRRADAGNTRLDALLDGIEVFPAAASLEDGFMVLLRKRYDAQMETIARDAEAMVTHRPVTGISDEIAIEVKDLVRTFGQFIAVDHVSFSVRRGEIFGLLGPNGAGKTTTFRVLCGLLPASSGFVHVAGVDLRHARAVARRNIGYVSQKFALYGDLSVRENLEFFGSAYGLYGARLYDRIRTVVEQFDLGGRENSPSGQLPGGFKQRLAMAVGLLHEPDILFLDEPTSGTDPLKRREFWRRITALSQVGTTIIITTHFMEEAEYCDRIVIQDAGKLLALGTPQEVRLQAGGKDGKLSMEQAFISIVERARQRENATHAEAAG